MSAAPPDTATGNPPAPLVPILLSLGTALSARGRHREAVDVLRQALAEREDKPVETIASALIGELLAIEDNDGALATCLELVPVAPVAVAPVLTELFPALRPAQLRQVVDRLHDVPWLPVVNTEGIDLPVRRALLSFVARAFLTLDHTEAAIGLLTGAADLVDGAADLLIVLADAESRRRRPDEAERALTRAEAVADRPDLTDAITHRLVRLYEKSGRSADVLARLPAVTATEPEVAAELHAIRALALLHVGDRPAAAEAVEKARELAPASVIVAQAGACAHLVGHEYEAARKTVEDCLAKREQNPALSFLRFQAMVEAGEELTEIDRPLRRFLTRMTGPELDECVGRSVRTRPGDDPALHYFLGVLHRAVDRPADAMRAAEHVIDLLAAAPAGEQPSLIAPAAHRLRALLLEADRPEEAAAEYTTAGHLSFDAGAFELAIELIQAAARLGEPSQQDRWILADSLLLSSYVPAEPGGVAVARVLEAIDVWQEAAARELPDLESVWAYVSRARMCLQLSKVEPDPHPMAVEALVWCECFSACSFGFDQFHETYGLITRLLDVHGLCLDFLATEAATTGTTASLSFQELLTAAANAGALEQMRGALDAWRLVTNDREWHRFDARYHLLRESPEAALAGLDAAHDEQPDFTDIWMRVKAHWLTGDVAAVEADAAAATALAPELTESFPVGAAWLHLIGGDAERAQELFLAQSDVESWISDIRTEVALARLAVKETDADAAARVARFTDTTRSYEDVFTIRVMAGILAARYRGAPDGPLAGIEARARDRLAAGGWPHDHRDDLAHLTAAAQDDDTHTPVAVLAVRGRVEIAERAWEQAIATYRALIPHLGQFPEAEAGVAQIAIALRDTVEDDAAVRACVAALAEATAELRRAGSRRVMPQPLELVLGDLHARLGDWDRARASHEAALALTVDDSVRGHLQGRLHALSSLRDLPDAGRWLTDALRSYEDSGQPPATTVFDDAAYTVRAPDDWQRLVDAWDRGRADDPVAAELAALGRFGLGQAHEQTGNFAAAAVALRDSVAAHTALFGETDEKTLTARQELARVLRTAGESASAEAEYAAIAGIRERTSGAADIATVRARWDLAWTRYLRGAVAAAEADYREVVVPGLRAALGDDDRSVLFARNELAIALGGLEEWDAAVTEYRAVLEGMRLADGIDYVNALSVHAGLADALMSMGDLDAAEAEFRAVVTARETLLGPADPSTVAVSFRYGLALRLMGRPADAAAVFEDVLTRQREALGEEDPDTLATRHQLAMTLAAREEYTAAVAEYGEVAAARARVLGEDAAGTLTTRTELARALMKGGNLEDAVAEFRAVLPKVAHTFGERHLETLETRTDLGYALYLLGDHASAVAEYRTAVAGLAAVLGEEHGDTVVARYWLGQSLAAQEDWAAALGELRVVRDAASQVFGPDGRDTWAAREEFARALRNTGALTEAEAELRSVIEGWTRTAGADDPDTLKNRESLASLLTELGRVEEAEEEYRTVLAAYERRGEATTGAALATRLDLAALLSEAGDLAAAEHELLRVLDSGQIEDGPTGLAARYGYAAVLVEQSRYDEARAAFAAALAAYEVGLGESHVDTLSVRCQLGHVLSRLGEWEPAERELRAAAAGLAAVAGPDAPGTLVCGFYLGSMLASVERYAEAEDQLRHVLEAEERVQGPVHPSTLMTRQRLAEVLFKHGDLDGAAAELRTVVAGRKEALGPAHPDTMSSWLDLGMAELARGGAVVAEAELRALLRQREELSGPDHEETLYVRYQVALTLMAQGRWEEAETGLRAVIGREREIHGAAHPNTLTTRHALAETLLAQGKREQATEEARAVAEGREQLLGAEDPASQASRDLLARVLEERE